MSRWISIAWIATAGVALADIKALGEGEEQARGILTSHLSELYAWPMLPLWACSIVLIALVFERFGKLKATNILDHTLADEVAGLMAKLDVDGAYERAKKSDTVVGRAWAQGLHEFQLGGVPLGEALTNASVLAFKPLKRNLQAINTIAVIAPLIGLLGTVVGMVMVFDEISVAVSPDKQAMAEGIMVSLFTTVFGMIVAIPGIVAGRYFKARIVTFADGVEADIDRVRYRYAHASATKKAEDDRIPPDFEDVLG